MTRAKQRINIRFSFSLHAVAALLYCIWYLALLHASLKKQINSVESKAGFIATFRHKNVHCNLILTYLSPFACFCRKCIFYPFPITKIILTYGANRNFNCFGGFIGVNMQRCTFCADLRAHTCVTV